MALLIRITTVPVSFKTLLRGQMNFMTGQGFDVIMISAGGKEVKEITTHERCRHIEVPLTRTINPLRDLVCLIKLIRIFYRLKPDIVHTHTPKAGLLGMMAAFICRVPVRMHTVAGLPWIHYRGFTKRLMIQLEKLILFLAHGVYPNSNKLLQVMEQYQIGKGKMKVLAHGTSNGINTSWYSKDHPEVMQNAAMLVNKAHVQPGASVWIFIGRLVKDKGIGELLKAFMQIVQEFKNDQLWLVGQEEPERDPLTAEQKEMMSSCKNIIQWGYQDDVRPFLAASGLLVFPSYREGFPNVPLQAASMECALILSDINGCNEIVTDGVNGFLVPPMNALQLYKTMHKLRTEPELKNRLALNAKGIIQNRFEQQNVWQAVLNEYSIHLADKKQKTSPTPHFHEAGKLQ